MTRPYKACEDNDLFALLYSLNHPCIHSQYIETDGSLLVKVSCCYNLDVYWQLTDAGRDALCRAVVGVCGPVGESAAVFRVGADAGQLEFFEQIFPGVEPGVIKKRK